MPKTKPPKRTRTILGLALGLALLALMPSVSQAAVSGSMSIQFPATVTVGQGDIPASLNLRNLNTAGEGTNLVCNAGDSGLCSGDPGIVLVPSCGAVSSSLCAVSDPGVFGYSATALGRAGTSCGGMTFSIDAADPAFGAVRFTPVGGAPHVSLPPAGAGCTIDFALSVQRSPSTDFNPGAEGVQTAQTGEHSQVSASAGPAKVRDTSSGTTVLRAAPTMLTTASADTAVGVGTLVDAATVHDLVNPVGGTIDFRLYGPDDETCAREPVFTSLGVPYPPGTGTVTSSAFVPTTPGSYRWSASYSGDANNLPVLPRCASPTIVTGGGRDRDRDGVPDAVDSCQSVPGDKRNGCPSELGADVRGLWRVNELLSKLVSLSVRAPTGSRIEVRCKGPRGACTFSSRVVKKTTKRITGLTRMFGRTRIFPAGTKISVFVSKARRRGTYERVLTRTGRRLPSVVNRCLSASLKVQRCP